MDIVIICNGLGNQMSQYAFFLRKKEIDKSTHFIYDRNSLHDHHGYELGKIFNIDYKATFINNILNLIFRILGIKKFPLIIGPMIKVLNFIGMSIVKECHNYDYDEELLKPSRGLKFYYGGWHSEKYFHSVESKVRGSLRFNIPEDDEKVQSALEQIKSTNSVSVHVRRGDFLSEKNMSMYGAVCSKEYFESAINEICSKIENPHFFVFSNDLMWVRENFQYENLTVIDFNKGADSWKDMYLMSNCKHNINSNSTFSWWAAWFNSNKNKIVIVPRFFINNVETKDIYPKEWLQLTDY